MATLRSPIDTWRRGMGMFAGVTLSILVVAGAVAYVFFRPFLISIIFPSNSQTPGIGVTTEAGGEQVGLSDGSYAFDTNRSDGNLKILAATALRQGNLKAADSYWAQALALPGESNDAEALIYREDQRVLASGNPYITLVVGTTLTGGAGDLSTGHDDLQGAYVAQEEYNQGLKLNGGTLVRLLIANAGSKADYTTGVAQRIVQAAQSTTPLQHIVGVMGWPYSSYVPKAMAVLAQAHIPMVSPTASSDTLTAISPYFFRVAPSNKSQAIAGAQYAEQTLHASQVAIFVDPLTAYSKSLASDFRDQFAADGNQVVATVNYTVGQAKALPALLQKVLADHTDLNFIYFAGYGDDLGVLLSNLPADRPDLQIVGGDALYELQAYPASARPGFNHLHFTAFAYPDEWDELHLTAQKPAFFILYKRDFDPKMVHAQGDYGYERSDNDVILSYDATKTLLAGANQTLLAGFTMNADTLKGSLERITGNQAIQGVSGQISLGANGDPVNKAIVVLYVDQNYFIHLAPIHGIQGCFLVGQC